MTFVALMALYFVFNYRFHLCWLITGVVGESTELIFGFVLIGASAVVFCAFYGLIFSIGKSCADHAKH